MPLTSAFSMPVQNMLSAPIKQAAEVGICSLTLPMKAENNVLSPRASTNARQAAEPEGPDIAKSSVLIALDLACDFSLWMTLEKYLR